MIMLEAILETLGEKIKQNHVFPNENHKTLIAPKKIKHNLLNSLRTASVCRTGT